MEQHLFLLMWDLHSQLTSALLYPQISEFFTWKMVVFTHVPNSYIMPNAGESLANICSICCFLFFLFPIGDLLVLSFSKGSPTFYETVSSTYAFVLVMCMLHVYYLLKPGTTTVLRALSSFILVLLPWLLFLTFLFLSKLECLKVYNLQYTVSQNFWVTSPQSQVCSRLLMFCLQLLQPVLFRYLKCFKTKNQKTHTYLLHWFTWHVFLETLWNWSYTKALKCLGQNNRLKAVMKSTFNTDHTVLSCLG